MHTFLFYYYMGIKYEMVIFVIKFNLAYVSLFMRGYAGGGDGCVWVRGLPPPPGKPENSLNVHSKIYSIKKDN